MRRCIRCLVLVAASALAADPPDLITCPVALAITGESTRHGVSSTAIVPAPDCDGLHSLQLRFRFQSHGQGDWVDAFCLPTPPLDLSGSRTHRLWIKAAQPTTYLHIKIVDPENPGQNQAAYEGALTHGDQPLPANRWVAVDLVLPDDPAKRNSITYLGFYIPSANEDAPLDQDLVFHVGRFPYTPPVRPPWPPETDTAGPPALEALVTTPLGPDGPWRLVSGTDNQTDHVARVDADGVVFNADADGWNEFLWSDPEELHLAPLTTYRLQFDYDVFRPATGDGAMFYSLVRAEGTIREDVGWQRWDEPAGTSGRRLITFTTHDMPGYYLIFGVRHHGHIRIANVRLWKVLKGASAP